MRIGSGATLVVSGDGRYYSKDAIQVQIIQFDSKGNIDCLIQWISLLVVSSNMILIAERFCQFCFTSDIYC